MKSLECNGDVLKYSIERKKRKTVSIRINEKCEVEISAPNFVRDEEIRKLLIKKLDWIREVINKRREEKIAENLSEGDCINYLGHPYPIILMKRNRKETEVELKEEGFYVYIDGTLETVEKDKHTRAALRNWYIQRARKVFLERIMFFSQNMRLYPRDIKVKGQKSLWGSCSSSNNLNFNYKLLLAPLQILDYIVVHELAHIRHKNHSNEFWKLVGEFVPDYREKREWLKRNGHTLEILENRV